MTIPFPRRFHYVHATVFAALLAIVLLAEGNPPTICLTIFALVMVGTFAFNLAGGLVNPVGAYVLFTVLFTGVAGTVTKALLNEPLEENVPNAGQTLLVYLIGTCGMAAAVLVSRKLALKKSLLEGKLTSENTSQVVVGCLAGGILVPILFGLLFSGGTVFGIIRQLNIALPLTVLIAVYQRTRETNGRSSFSWPAMAAALYTTYSGVIGFSKEGIFSSWLAWVVAAAAARLRITIPQVIVSVVGGLGAVLLLVPITQYGRNFRNNGSNVEVAMDLLSRPLEVRRMVKAKEAEAPPELYHWYRNPEGIMDRLTLVPIDSALIYRTDALGPIGLTNIGNYFINILPHFILPDKAELNTGNQYAHEIGMLAGADHTTGISFSPYAEAYHTGGWFGLIFVMPAVLTFMFTTIQSVAGDTDRAPWALFFIAAFGHLAAEGSLLFPVYIGSYGCEALLATAYFMVYITPIIGTLIIGPGRTAVKRQVFARAVPRRAPSSITNPA